ncbi:MAG: TldD/PmbA family protein [Acidobacteria bacterium]|nr:TldD/PmbA family protein [Acidobacteriota bacterium]
MASWHVPRFFRGLSRRDFISTGMKGMAIVSVPMFFGRDPLAALTAAPAGTTPADLFARFGIDESILRQVMVAALERGGDFCDLYFQHTISSYIGLEDKIVNQAYTSVDLGVGIRVVKGDQTGFSFTEDLSVPAMRDAARTAAAIAEGPAGKAPTSFTHQKLPNHYVINTGWENVSADRKVPFLQKLNDLIFAGDKRIIKASAALMDDTSFVLLASSDGLITYDYQPMAQLRASCSAEQDGRRENSYADLCGREGIEFFTAERVKTIAADAVRRTVSLFDATKPEGGEMEVVLEAGSSGILLHEAIGHGMEADFNRKGISIFADKIGKPVAEKFVTIVDDGTNPNVRGSLNVDDEGNGTQRTYLVQDGVLASYMHDRISASHYKVQPTGNGRRESFRFAPMPRMRNTYMLPGPHKRDEIIASVKKGILAEMFTNGQVFIGAGDFTFYVKSGYLIENGKLTRPVKDINIIGNGPEVLRKVVMVADDFKMADGGWTCGKDGQGVPVSMGLPTVKVSSITVGGVQS